MPPQLFLLLALAAALAVLCPDALAAAKKPGGKGKGKKGSGKPHPSRRPKAPDGGDASVEDDPTWSDFPWDELPLPWKEEDNEGYEEEYGTGPEHPPAPEGWAEWDFPAMGLLLEKQRFLAETKQRKGDLLGAAHDWDGLRALARNIFGPRDPRTFASLSRSARSLAEHVIGPRAVAGPLSAEMASGAASMASGVLLGLEDAEIDPQDSSPMIPWPGLMAGFGPQPNLGDPPGDWGGKTRRETSRALAEAIAGEKAFASDTLQLIRARAPHAVWDSAPPLPLMSLSEAVYPKGRHGESDPCPFPPPDELRRRLSAAEAPGGPGPKSREALVLMSRLGEALTDFGGEDQTFEGTGLMRNASKGLDSLAGPGDPDALEAKERLARRLAGLSGYGKILEPYVNEPSRGNLSQAHWLFRNIWKLAPAGEEGEPLRLRSRMCTFWATFAKKVLAESDSPDGTSDMKPTGDFIMSAGWLMAIGMEMDEGEGDFKMPGAWVGRSAFDFAEMMHFSQVFPAYTHFHRLSLRVRRHALGGRHPETARSMSCLADGLYPEKEEKAAAYWAQALEALEDQGETEDLNRAEVEFRLGRAVMMAREYGQAIPILEKSEETFRRLLGETHQRTLTPTISLAQSLYWAGFTEEAGKIYARTVSLLEDIPDRKRESRYHTTDKGYLSVAMAGLGATMYLRGERKEGIRLLKSSGRMRDRVKGDENPVGLGDLYRKIFLNPDGVIKFGPRKGPVAPDGDWSAFPQILYDPSLEFDDDDDE
ncbi:MAG: tetratricopeptide repeat protein [Deltaproteobacteria bacterium]|jgi:tetratricopeptide (TPR) repeat protein|nr:tetratricopeptide repeat protein [Deltaproteobacteria bacterium]